MRLWLFRSGIDEKNKEKEVEAGEMQMEGGDGSKRRKPKAKPDVNYTAGFRRTQLRGKILAYIGATTASTAIATKTAGSGQARAGHGGYCSCAMLL
jgi:hypothetical protein